eukprot:TRINITY_DN2445_c0_g1_i1.p1 TRINITY_DN2445_c0_g1~~TRINITY_DN2445_c0_g1_i1.p1  ORF type:complete len:168 (+),score=27.30 TRINITY_DN2445_c0_g1_i1:173-676(+)
MIPSTPLIIYYQTLNKYAPYALCFLQQLNLVIILTHHLQFLSQNFVYILDSIFSLLLSQAVWVYYFQAKYPVRRLTSEEIGYLCDRVVSILTLYVINFFTSRFLFAAVGYFSKGMCSPTTIEEGCEQGSKFLIINTISMILLLYPVHKISLIRHVSSLAVNSSHRCE